MIALTTTRNRWTRYLATLLLVLQGLAGGAVSLAHASERLTAPAHIEAQHGSACLALHDELRCALCQWAGAQAAPPRDAARTPMPSRRGAPTRGPRLLELHPLPFPD